MSRIIKSGRVVDNEFHLGGNDEKKIKSEIAAMVLYDNQKKIDQMLSQASQKASKIIEDAEKQKDDILHDAYNRSKDIFEEAKEDGHSTGYKDGYEDGMKKSLDEGKIIIDGIIEESLEIKNDYYEKRENLLKSLEKDIIDLVIAAIDKVVEIKSEEDSELIVSLVLNGMNNIDNTDSLTIITSKEDYNIIDMVKNEILAKSSLVSDIDIKYDNDLSKGDCIIETSRGSVDASLGIQIEGIKELIHTILDNE